MNLEEFDAQFREAIDETLNQLQTATLLAEQLDNKIEIISDFVRQLALKVESFIEEQKSN